MPGLTRLHRHMLTLSSLLAVVGAAGCTDGADPGPTDDTTTPEVTILSDYQLTLQPVLLDGYDPLADGGEVTLVVTPPDGDATLYDGSADVVSGLPPLDAGTRIGLIVQDDGDPLSYDPGRLRAYGDIVLSERLDTGEVEVTEEVFLPPFADPGVVYEAAEADQRFAAGVASLADGTTFVFGGTQLDRLNATAVAARDSIFVIDPRTLSEHEVLDERMPEVTQGDLDTAVRAGLTATTFERDGESLILVAGGRPDWGITGDNTLAAHIFDPAQREFVEDLDLPAERSDHHAVLLSNGDILIDGGFASTGLGHREAMIFHADDSSFDTVTLGADAGNLLRSGAPLEDDGALICGGVSTGFNLAGNDWEPVDYCVVVTEDADVREVAPMPVPLAGHTMTLLPNGDILVAGGTDETLLRSGPPNAASDSAYLYDADAEEWESLPDLTSARSGHAAFPLANGDVVLVGGVSAQGTLFNFDDGEPVACAERYSFESQTFTELPGCNDLAAGAYARVSPIPGGGGVVFTGTYRADDGRFLGTYDVGYAAGATPPGL